MPMEDQELQQLEEAVLHLLAADTVSEEYQALLTNEEKLTYLCETLHELAEMMDEAEQEE